jgi:hypothetical protein
VRKTLIFGNGLGMSIDAQHFYLPNALNDVWDSGNLNDTHKKMIAACLPGTMVRCPQGEHELDLLHQAITSCNQLKAIDAPPEVHWLTKHGWDFPAVCRGFISKVATRLYDYNGRLPQAFVNPLVDFLRNTNSHVATLNYDKLLYDWFIKTRLVDGYEGSLIDGICTAGFRRENLVRRYGNNFGYYLHLHGSPLFKDRSGVTVKVPRHRLNLEQAEPSSHIVLTHIQHKPSVIASSEILSAYWGYLALSLSESTEVILFGYSGADAHLNQYLSMYSGRVAFKVVEWRGAGDFYMRRAFWGHTLNSHVELIQLDSLMEFNDWYW